MQTRFHRPPHRRFLHREVPRYRNRHNPHRLQGLPTAVTPTAPSAPSGPSGPGWRHRRRDRPQPRACAALQIPGRPPVLPPGPLVIRSGGPLTAGAAYRQGGRNAVKARGCATAQGSQAEDRSRAPAELPARFSVATRTRLREPSRSAGTTRSPSLPVERASPDRCLCIAEHIHKPQACRPSGTSPAPPATPFAQTFPQKRSALNGCDTLPKRAVRVSHSLVQARSVSVTEWAVGAGVSEMAPPGRRLDTSVLARRSKHQPA